MSIIAAGFGNDEGKMALPPLLDKVTFLLAMICLVAWMVMNITAAEGLIRRLDKAALKRHAARGLVRTASIALAFASLFATIGT